MRRTRFDNDPCPIARTADLLGDWWTPLVLRELVLGRRRFAQIQEPLDISRPVLTERLKRLVDEGVIDKVAYQQRPVRYEYSPTDKGLALWDVLVAMWQFGDTWLFDDGAPVELFHRETGERIEPITVDKNTGQQVALANTRLRVRS